MTMYKYSKTILKAKCCVFCGQSEWFCLCSENKFISSISIFTDIEKKQKVIDDETNKKTLFSEKPLQKEILKVLPKKQSKKEVFEDKKSLHMVCVQNTISKEIELRPSFSRKLCVSNEISSTISTENDYWECNCGTLLKHNEECIYCRQC